jgi:hypothetical protein
MMQHERRPVGGANAAAFGRGDDHRDGLAWLAWRARGPRRKHRAEIGRAWLIGRSTSCIVGCRSTLLCDRGTRARDAKTASAPRKTRCWRRRSRESDGAEAQARARRT